MSLTKVWKSLGVFSLLACSSNSTASGERDALSDLADARSVWVAELDGDGLTDETETLLDAATFEQASDANAARIVALLGDERNYMRDENACYNRDAAVRFQFEDGDTLYALIGLTCWNVNFTPGRKGQSVPQSRYLMPAALQDLALMLQETVPSLDISDVGE